MKYLFGFLIVGGILFGAYRFWQRPQVHAHLKYSYTILVEDELLREGQWPALWEPLKAQFPDVEFVLRPLMEGPLPPFDLIIGSQTVMDRAQELNLREPFVETGYQMLYYRKGDPQALPEGWAQLNLEGQKYENASQQKFYVATPDQAQTFLPLLAGRSTSTAAVFDLIRDLRLSYRSVPLGCQVACALRLFEENKSPLLWHTDLYLGDLSARLGDKLGLAPLPTLDERLLRTPRRTIYVGEASHPIDASRSVTQALMQSWKGTAGSLLIFKSLHLFASGLLETQEKTGDPLLDRLKDIVQNHTVAMHEKDLHTEEDKLRPIMKKFLAAELSAADAARQTDLVLRAH